MSNLIPTIVLENGERYEIKRSRFVLCEIEKMREQTTVSEEDTKEYALLQEKYGRLEKFALRVAELEDDYLTDFADEKLSLYEKAKEQYTKMLAEAAEYELATKGVAARIHKDTINKIEQLIITLLCIDENGNKVMEREDATEVWCSFVDKVGHQVAQEWLIGAFNYLQGNEEEETDPFVMARRSKAEQKANMRRGIVKAK